MDSGGRILPSAPSGVENSTPRGKKHCAGSANIDLTPANATMGKQSSRFRAIAQTAVYVFRVVDAFAGLAPPCNGQHEV